MPPHPTVLGINRTQDASICLLDESSLISIQKERITRFKHHWGRVGDLKQHYATRVPGLSEPIDLVVECFSSDEEIKNLKQYDRELEEVIKFRGLARKISISHHWAHLYSTFYLSPYDGAAVMVVDFQGSHVNDITEEWPGREDASPKLVEVSSFYYCDEKSNTCLGKQLWDAARANPLGLGRFIVSYLTCCFQVRETRARLWVWRLTVIRTPLDYRLF